jgi:UDP-N-acetylglucosamine diphosphorylase/glucosamine-1-phosphate N-acetyltransferase
MRLCIFEDEGYAHLLPLTYLRPVYELRCGIHTLKEKITRAYPELSVTLLCREVLEEVLRESNPGVAVNELPGERYLFVNGRVLFSPELKSQISLDKEAKYVADGTVVAAVVSGKALEGIRSAVGRALTSGDFAHLPERTVQARLLNYSWDFVHYNSEEIAADFRYLNCGGVIEGTVGEGVILVEKSNIYIGPGAKISPGTILDAEEGPIYIGPGAKVMHNATIIGPASVGEKSAIKVGAKIYEGTSIGEVCKVGGEVEESIIHSYSNKQHDGFLGHAYLGQWVNIGADTNNSDLKNNYSTVKVYVNGKMVDSGSLFVGATIGDHSKTGINTMLNTGTVIGVFANVYGGGFPPKFIPSFAWGGAEGLVEHQLEKAIATARQVMKRRDKEVTPSLEKLFRAVFEMTREEREKVLGG